MAIAPEFQKANASVVHIRAFAAALVQACRSVVVAVAWVQANTEQPWLSLVPQIAERKKRELLVRIDKSLLRRSPHPHAKRSSDAPKIRAKRVVALAA